MGSFRRSATRCFFPPPCGRDSVTPRVAPTLVETERLLLRMPVPDDAELIFTRYASDSSVTRYMSFRRHESIDDTRTFLDFSRMEWLANGCGPYLVLLRGSGLLLGGTGLSIQFDEAETGYVFARDAWGRGYATESLTAMVQVARGVGLHALHARCHPEHRASARVLEKCGFTLEQRVKSALVFPNLSPERQDVLSYALTLGLP